MRRPWCDQFPLAPDLVMLNHASYGLAPTAMLEHGAALRAELERDPNTTLGEPLLQRLREVVAVVADALGLAAASCALTTSATAGAAAVQRSLPLEAGDEVVVLDCEYSSVIRGWRRRCAEVGATLHVVPVRLPFDGVDELLDRMSAAAGASVAVLQFSAITSAAALRLPVDELAAWGRRRGATVVVDAAHAPFHVDVSGWHDVDVAFGTLHKWLPVPRSVGILWSAIALQPAETSLTFDERGLGDRFAWPGTFDPAPRLALPKAVALQRIWADEGAIGHAEELADYAVGALTEVGAIPTAGVEHRPPRLRAFLVPDVDLDALRRHLLAANVRAWTGRHDPSACLVRVATHVYNDRRDVDALAKVVTRVVRG